MRNFHIVKSVLFYLLMTMTCLEVYSFTLVITSDNKLKNLEIREYNGTGSTKVSVGSNVISLENYPNAVYLYQQKGRSNSNFLPMIWVPTDTSIVQITMDGDYNVIFEDESLCQIELNKIFASSKNIHLGPFLYKPQQDKPLEPILALEAKAIIQNLEVVSDRNVLMNLFKLSEERGINNWSTDVLSAYVKNNIYDQTAGKLIKISGLDSLENQVEIKPNSKKHILIAISGSWCGPCIKGLPKLREMYDRVSDQVIIVSTWNDPNLETFKNSHRDKKQVITWPSLWDPYGLMGNSLHIKAYPSYILFDPSGSEINRWDGEFPNNLKAYIPD